MTDAVLARSVDALTKEVKRIGDLMEKHVGGKAEAPPKTEALPKAEPFKPESHGTGKPK